MTVSIGVAGQTDSDTLIETVIARADSALYKAKHAGRNRVVVYRAPADRQSQSAMS
jgi:diguanylate cyclase (GGDEF)-like protein